MAVKKGRKDNTPEAIILRRRRELRNRRILSSAIQKLIVLTAMLGILFGFIFGIAPMKGDDMKPQLSAGDLMIFYRLEKNLLRNDVIVMERDGSQYVGRLVGMPGDVLIIKTMEQLTSAVITFMNPIYFMKPTPIPIRSGIRWCLKRMNILYWQIKEIQQRIAAISDPLRGMR